MEKLAEEKKNKLAKKKELEIHYMELYHSGNTELRKQAVEYFVNGHLGYIGGIIKKRYRSFMENHYHDMLQCGVMGIVLSLEKFDPKRTRLTTFAYTYVIHELTLYISENIYMTSPHYADNLKKVNNAITFFENHDMAYTSEDICERTGLKYDTVLQTLQMRTASNLVFLDENEEVADSLSFPDSSPDAVLEQKEREDTLIKALNSLDDKTRLVLQYRFGINPEGRVINLSDLAHMMKTSIDEIRRIQNVAILTLRTNPELRSIYKDYTTASERKMREMEISLLPPEEDSKDLFSDAAQLFDGDCKELAF